MKTKLRLKFIVFSLLISCKSNISNVDNNETFLGYEYLGVLDKSQPETKWFHETLIKFKKDSVFIDQNPILINNKDTLYSSRDGGFYYFKGIKTEKNNVLTINTEEISCDYCSKVVKKINDKQFEEIIRLKNYDAYRVLNGLQIGNQVFLKIKNRNLLSETINN